MLLRYEAMECAKCGEGFHPTRPEHVYCTRRCKDRAYRAANREERAAHGRAYYAANREAVLARNRAYSAANREERAAKARAYRAANSKAYLARNRAYHAANRKKIAAKGRAWKAANPEKRRESTQRRRARKAGAEGHTTAAEFTDICTAQGGLCAYCGAEAPLELEHAIPLSGGGSNWPSNIVGACRPCNSSKGTSSVEEFLARREAAV